MQNFYLLNLAAHLSLLVCYFVCGALLLLLYRIAVKDYSDTMSALLGWLLWPDVDIKFLGGKEFIKKYTSKKFTRYNQPPCGRKTAGYERSHDESVSILPQTQV